MSNNSKLIGLVAIAAMMFSVSTAAGPFDKLTKSLPGMGSDEPAISATSALDQQAELMDQVSEALTNLSSSQALMAEALGLKEEAAIAQQNADSLAEGGITGSDDMDKKLASSDSVNSAIEQKLDEGTELDEESKKIFAASIPPYGLGSVGMVTSAKTASSTATSLTASSDPAILAKLGDLKTLINFGKAAPSIITGFKDTTSKIIKFAQANNIDTSELEADVADW